MGLRREGVPAELFTRPARLFESGGCVDEGNGRFERVLLQRAPASGRTGGCPPPRPPAADAGRGAGRRDGRSRAGADAGRSCPELGSAAERPSGRRLRDRGGEVELTPRRTRASGGATRRAPAARRGTLAVAAALLLLLHARTRGAQPHRASPAAP